jgi:MFS transporter, SP family, xylose:H+ symportor
MNVAVISTETHSAHGSPNTILVWLVASAAALGGLLFGYDRVVIGGAKPFYERYFHLDTPSMAGWAMSCALAGCLIGALTPGPMCSRTGRKLLLTVAAMAFAVSSIGVGLAQSFTTFVAWRIMGGYAIGLQPEAPPARARMQSASPHLRTQIPEKISLTGESRQA